MNPVYPRWRRISQPVLTLFVLLLLTLLTNQARAAHAQDDAVVLSGRVTAQEDGTPISGITIALHDAGFPGRWDVATTDSSGSYTVTEAILDEVPNLIPGVFPIEFQSNGVYISEFYDNMPEITGAARMTLTLDTPTTGIDAALVEGGEVRGTIIGQDDNQPLSPTTLTFYNLAGDEVASYFNPSATGVYTATGVPAGTYKVRAEGSGGDRFHVAAYYPNAQTFAEGDEIEIDAGELLTDINFSLLLGGQITGTLTTDTRGAVIVPEIEVYNAVGERITLGRIVPFLVGAEYAIANLPAGEYRIRYSDESGRHRAEFHDGATTLGAATPLTVIAGQTTFAPVELAYIPRVSGIATSRLVTDAILLTLDFNPTPRYTANRGQTWHQVATSPWINESTFTEPGIGLAPRAESGLPRRMLVGGGPGFQGFPSALYRSGDNGQSWATTPFATTDCDSESFSDVVASPFDPAQLFVLHTCIVHSFGVSIASGNLFLSNDAGATWEKTGTEDDTFPLGRYLTQLLASPNVDNRLYLRDDSTWRQSNDDGETWTDTTFLIELLALDATNAQWLYGITGFASVKPQPRVGQRSEDGGQTWVDWPQQPCSFDIDPETAADNTQIMAHPTQTKVIFVRCDQGVYRSTDGGDSWTQLENTPGHLLAPDYSTPGRIFWGNENGLFASTDNGDTWQPIMPNYALTTPDKLEPLYLPHVATNE